MPASLLDGYQSPPSVIGVQNTEEQIELKPDLPKLDKPKILPPPPKRDPLKGSIQHQEMVKQSGQGNGGSGNGLLDGSARRGTLDSSANAGIVKGKLNANRVKDPNELGLGIIGVKFAMGFGNAPIVYEVFPGTPAADAGMRVKDIILAVDGIPTIGLTKDEVYNMIVGQPNTEVTISFQRRREFEVRKMMRLDLNKIADPQLRHDYLRW